jgi:hypothetical protein
VNILEKLDSKAVDCNKSIAQLASEPKMMHPISLHYLLIYFQIVWLLIHFAGGFGSVWWLGGAKSSGSWFIDFSVRIIDIFLM